jgi:hypothetical protein
MTRRGGGSHPARRSLERSQGGLGIGLSLVPGGTRNGYFSPRDSKGVRFGFINAEPG